MLRPKVGRRMAMPGEANAIREAEGEAGGVESDKCTPVDVDGLEMAHKMSIVMTACPVFKSHCL